MMHGEYKMPGGKLIVADLAIRNGRLAEVHISGDFFLEPDTALDAINRVLEGLHASSGTEKLAEAVDSALGQEVNMYGISAEAVAIAVQRALETQA